MRAARIVIVGGGIVGLAHALAAARRGHQVTLFERHPRAVGASIRNFGMIWPIGQPQGPPREAALLSRRIWLDLAREAGLWVNACGSIHLAHRQDELAILEEYCDRSALGSQGTGGGDEPPGGGCQLLTPQQVLARSPGVNPQRLLGGLFSPTELGINPVRAVAEIARWLSERFGAHVHFSTMVTAVEEGRITTAGGRHWPADRIVVCGGADIETLFPGLIDQAGLTLCKLHMLRTPPQPSGWRLGPHLASGLTLRHYRNFEVCPSLAALKRRVAEETPELDRYGIHVMAAQNDADEVILGDSHEYGDAIEPFDKVIIDQLIVRELQAILQLPDWSIAHRWHGHYAKHPELPIIRDEPMPGVHIRTGTGGAGMTLSLGLAEQDWRAWSAAEST